MTREEAVQKLLELEWHQARLFGTSSATQFIAGLVALGLLHLESPRTTDQSERK